MKIVEIRENRKHFIFDERRWLQAPEKNELRIKIMMGCGCADQIHEVTTVSCLCNVTSRHMFRSEGVLCQVIMT